VLRIPVLFQRAMFRAMDHDALNIAQSAAYSGMVALFPALIVASAVVGLLPTTAPVRYELAVFFDRVLPSDVSPLLASYFSVTQHTATSGRALVLSVLVSVSGASGVIATFMEGVRRAYDLPADCWSFWQRRRRAIALVPMSLIPMGLASILVVFGHYLSLWLAMHSMPQVRTLVYGIALLIRWTVSLTGSVGLIALLYHLGTPMRQTWRRTLPGAVLATLMWFAATLVFGWYVTRFANYSRVYGSLGAGIALLFWLYLISLSVLYGAEFNAQIAGFREIGSEGGGAVCEVSPGKGLP